MEREPIILLHDKEQNSLLYCLLISQEILNKIPLTKKKDSLEVLGERLSNFWGFTIDLLDTLVYKEFSNLLVHYKDYRYLFFYSKTPVNYEQYRDKILNYIEDNKC